MNATHLITQRNVNGVFSDALWRLDTSGVREPSRNGDVLVLPAPTIVTYRRPQERVLFSAERDANPFFHFMESLWMLGGRNDVAWIQHYNSRMGEYSDDKVTQWGAYGWRWRQFFDDGRDQLCSIIEHLKEQPASRRAVLTMWSPDGDLWERYRPEDGGDNPTPYGGLKCRDVPCNTHIYFLLRDDKLEMTVCNRSNDIVWGMCGANAVHMSMLQEYIAMHLGVGLGPYHQFTNNLHVYVEKFPDDKRGRMKTDMDDRYAGEIYYHKKPVVPMSFLTPVESADEWDRDLKVFLENPHGTKAYYTEFFQDTVMPMYWAWEHRKRGVSSGLSDAKEICASDWRTACVEWIERREAAKAAV